MFVHRQNYRNCYYHYHMALKKLLLTESRIASVYVTHTHTHYKNNRHRNQYDAACKMKNTIFNEQSKDTLEEQTIKRNSTENMIK